MDSPDVLVLPDEQKRQLEIDGIVEKDKQEFDDWIHNIQGKKARLDMPKGALRYLTIPRRILELADNPSKVDVLTIEQTAESVRLYVFEHKQQPVTNKTSLETYWDDLDRKSAEEQAKAEAEGSPFIFIHPKPPSDVDEYHAKNRQLVNEGELQLTDFVTNDIGMSVSSEQQIMIGSYWDRPTHRGKGVAKSFYTRLRDVTAQMGFRFITGGNNPSNIGFFTQTLGRSTLGQIKPELRNQFLKEVSPSALNEFTVDFLHPEDRTAYLIPQSNIKK